MTMTTIIDCINVIYARILLSSVYADYVIIHKCL